MHILNRQQILAAFDAEAITALLKQGFIAYSQRRVQQPPVQHFLFEQAAGDCCIKSAGWKATSCSWSRSPPVSIATPNAAGQQSGVGDGVLRPDRRTPALLQDEGWLTALRTALAGRIAAELCAPPHIQAIGMVGTGLQARLQLQCLKPVTDCREVWVWGRNEQALAAYRRDAEAEGFRVLTTQDAAELAAHCQLIVTTTPSREPILQAADIRPGTHITAVGADAPASRSWRPIWWPRRTRCWSMRWCNVLTMAKSRRLIGKLGSLQRQSSKWAPSWRRAGGCKASRSTSPSPILPGWRFRICKSPKGCWRQYKGRRSAHFISR